ncbi:MAG: peptidyl-tRNA hydrolase [Candidatus Diapherotrites archaeon]|nr:peptidyl-tRNA hydrolase [Candidatus Diapherotrites archaeon]
MKQAVVARTDLKMGKGKICSQIAHASVESFLLTRQRRQEWAEIWLAEGQKKIILKVESEQALKDLYNEVRHEIPAVLVVDAGYTQIHPGTTTCLGIGPAPETVIDKYISHYKLL